MSRFTVKQHDNFVRAEGKRKHLNSIIFDRCQDAVAQRQVATQGNTCPPYTQQAQQYQPEARSMASGSNGWPASADHHSANAWKELHSLSQLDGMQQHCGGVLLQQHQQQQHDKQPSWLMPWQTGNRQAGRQVALAMKSKRTPIGGFEQHDLAKAPK